MIFAQNACQVFSVRWSERRVRTIPQPFGDQPVPETHMRDFTTVLHAASVTPLSVKEKEKVVKIPCCDKITSILLVLQHNP